MKKTTRIEGAIIVVLLYAALSGFIIADAAAQNGANTSEQNNSITPDIPSFSMSIPSASTSGLQSQSSPTSLIINYDQTRIEPQKIKPGESGTLIIVIQNTGGFEARDVRAWIPDTGNVKGGGYWSLGDIVPGQSVTAKTTLRLDKGSYIGTHVVTVQLEYKSYWIDSFGKKDSKNVKTNWQVPIEVYGDANFQISADDDEFYNDVAGDLRLRGNVKQEVFDVDAILRSSCASILGSEKIYTGHLNANQNFILNYKIKPKIVGTCPFSLELKYDDASGRPYSEMLSFGLDVKRTTIDMKVLDVTYPLLSPGDTAEISFTLKNVGNAVASDATIILGLTMEDVTKISPEFAAQMASEYPFVVVDSSEKYIEDFQPDESRKVSFRVKIDKDAKAKAYDIPLKIKFFDPSGMQHDISKTVGIQIMGEPEIEVNIKESEITKNKNIGKITVEILNKGSSDAQFFDIMIIPTEKYTVISKDEEYIGTLESDDSENVDFNIKVLDTQDQDKVTISLLIEYKDNYNKKYSKNIEIDLDIISDNDLGGGGSMIFNIIILAVLVIAGYLIYRKFFAARQA